MLHGRRYGAGGNATSSCGQLSGVSEHRWLRAEAAPSSIAIEVVSDALPEGDSGGVVRINHRVNAGCSDRVSLLVGNGHQTSGDSPTTG